MAGKCVYLVDVYTFFGKTELKYEQIDSVTGTKNYGHYSRRHCQHLLSVRKAQC